MFESRDEYRAWLTKNEVRIVERAERLQRMFPGHARLAREAAIMWAQLFDMDKEIKRLKQQIASEEEVHDTISLMGHPKFSTAGLMEWIEEDARDLSSPTAVSVVKAMAILKASQQSERSEIARKGGLGKKPKLDRLEAETIRLYELGKWGSAPKAALEITPQIVKISTGGNGDLLPSTTKPLEWIRAYEKRKKVASTK